MQIFCDESGGCDVADKHTFLVSAVAIDAADATRVIKMFKKTIKEKGEIKGGLLLDLQREAFFDILRGESEHSSVIVTSANSSDLGRWAIKALGERNIYHGMLKEACSSFNVIGAKRINIFPDSGRYSKQERSYIQKDLEKKLAHLYGVPVSLAFQDSRSQDGIQVADIVANSVYQLCGAGIGDFRNHHLFQPLAEKNRFTVRPTSYNGNKPHWL
ncbi:DUF3800 domain-containing protein [Ochrobactrum sp. S1502_03]|uniref:DUF3800 domain-containing protein n=1 Tax=Ochrobactrum sp. S1502_03 TaxID=3108451 RepID=UPI0037C8941C